MYSDPLFYAILGSLLGIIGFILVLWGAGLIRKKVTNKRIYFGIVFFGVGLSMLIINAPVYATPFTVLAMLALAFAAFRTIKQSSEHEQRRRAFEGEKENRDRNEHWLDEILKWANDIDNATSKELERGYFGLGELKHPDSFNDKMMDNMMQRLDVDLISSGELIKLLRQAIYIKTISDGIDVELGEKVQEVMNTLQERHNLLERRKEPELFNPEEENQQKRLALECIRDETKPLDSLSIYWQIAVLLNRNLRILMDSVDNLIKKTSEIKVNLLRTITQPTSNINL